MRRGFVEVLTEYNPFYLLSALSMLLGCYTLSRALAVRPGETAKLVLLLATLNLYEFSLIGLVIYLVARRRLSRDGRILLWIEALFLVDATSLQGEFFAADISTGGLVGAGALVLAGLKVGLAARGLGLEIGRRRLTLLGVLFALLTAAPGYFAFLAAKGALSPRFVYLAWWAVGLAVLLAFWQSARREQVAGRATVGESFLGALFWGLAASLALHLLSGAWVYEVSFQLSYLGPVLLAFGVVRIAFDVAWIPPPGASFCQRLRSSSPWPDPRRTRLDSG